MCYVRSVPETADTALSEALRARGLRVTPQRLAIARALRELDESGVRAAAQAAGFAVDDAQLVVRGLCADCRQRD